MKNNITKKRLFIFGSIVSIMFLFGTFIVLLLFNNKTVEERLLQKIKKKPEVYDVEILFYTGILKSEFTIRIIFIDEVSLIIENVNPWGRSTRKGMRITYCNDYFVLISHIDGHNFNPRLNMCLLSNVIKIKMKSVIEIIENYQIISQHIKNWPDLSVYKIHENERLYEVRDRLDLVNLFPDFIVTINNQKYFLSKFYGKHMVEALRYSNIAPKFY